MGKESRILLDLERAVSHLLKAMDQLGRTMEGLLENGNSIKPGDWPHPDSVEGGRDEEETRDLGSSGDKVHGGVRSDDEVPE